MASDLDKVEEATETQTVVDPLVEQAAQIVSGMTLEEKVAQMFFIAVLLIGMKLLLLKRVINKRDF